MQDRWETTPMEAFSRLGPRGLHLVEQLRSRGVAAPPEAYACVGDKDAIAKMLASDPSLIENDGWARAAIEITNNPQCAVVAEYLRELLTSEPAQPKRHAPPP